MPEPHAGGCEDRIADRGSDNGRRWLAEADWNLVAVDKLDVEFRHVADAQRRIGIEVCVLYLTFYELGALVQRHTEAPKRGAFDLRQRAIRIHDGAGID